jgi:putative transposase
MARPLRILYEDAFYHVTARGNERKRIFLSQSDFETFLRYLKEALQKYGTILHAFVLMPTAHHPLPPKGESVCIDAPAARGIG